MWDKTATDPAVLTASNSPWDTRNGQNCAAFGNKQTVRSLENVHEQGIVLIGFIVGKRGTASYREAYALHRRLGVTTNEKHSEALQLEGMRSPGRE